MKKNVALITGFLLQKQKCVIILPVKDILIPDIESFANKICNAICNAHGAYPISIHSEYELKFAQSLSGHANTRLGAGLANGGGPDAITGWTWIDGSSFNFVNWADGEPSGPADTEQCIEMWTNGLWNDNSCDKVSLKVSFNLKLIF